MSGTESTVIPLLTREVETEVKTTCELPQVSKFKKLKSDLG